jgi:hypothetical protein
MDVKGVTALAGVDAILELTRPPCGFCQAFQIRWSHQVGAGERTQQVEGLVPSLTL